MKSFLRNKSNIFWSLIDFLWQIFTSPHDTLTRTSWVRSIILTFLFICCCLSTSAAFVLNCLTLKWYSISKAHQILHTGIGIFLYKRILSYFDMIWVGYEKFLLFSSVAFHERLRCTDFFLMQIFSCSSMASRAESSLGSGSNARAWKLGSYLIWRKPSPAWACKLRSSQRFFQAQ